MTTQKGEARLAVEAALKKATHHSPLTTTEISERAGIAAALVRTHVGNIVSEGMAYNLRPGSKNSAYVWGRRPTAEPLPQLRDIAAPSKAPRGPYVPPAMRCTRPQDGPHPSRENGEIVEHKRPVIIGAKVQPLGGR